MTLIQQIQDDVVNRSVPLATALSRAKLLSARLKSEELRRWVDREISGYWGPGSEVPEYRKFRFQSAGFFQGGFGAYESNKPIPMIAVPKALREVVQERHFREGVGQLESYAKNSEPVVEFHWPADAVAMAKIETANGLVCTDAWQVVPVATIVGLLDDIRDRLLTFLMDLEAMSPLAGEPSPEAPPVAAQTVNNLVYQVLLGVKQVTIQQGEQQMK
jgi:hypothetical protein